MMRFLLIAFFILNSSFCISQNWEWVKLMQPSSPQAGMGVVVGPNGNVYGYGSYASGLALNNGVNMSGDAGFICMFDTAGQCQWAQKITANSGCGCSTFIPTAKIYGFDNAGNIIVAGMYCGCGADFGNGITTPDNANTMYLAKFSAAGQCLWVKTKASTSVDFVADVAIDEQDNIYMSISNNANGVIFCGLNFPSQGSYFTKINSNGVGIWNKQTSSGSSGYAIWQIKSFNKMFYVASQFASTNVFGTYTITPQGSLDVAILKMDTAGTIFGASDIGGSGGQIAAISIVNSNNKVVLLSQSNASIVSAGSYTVNTGISKDKSFLITYDTNLNVLNARNTANDSIGTGFSLTADKWGGIYVLSYNSATTDYGNLTGVAAGRNMIKMDANLNNFWYLQNVGNFVAPDTLGNVYIIDKFYNSATYGPFSQNTTGLGITLGKIQNALTPVGGPAGREQNNLSVYPNPGEGVFNLKINGGIKNKKSVIITLIDAIGKEISLPAFTQPDDLTLQVDLSSLAKGLYVVKVMADGVSYTAKLER